MATNVASVNTNATNIANINQNAANIVAIQNASTNATNAASSATAAAGSATAAAASAAAANAVVLGNEPVAPSIRPSLNLDFANTRALDPRITFTRTTTATYYDGKTTAKAEENLFLRSQELNTIAVWPTSGITSVSANTGNTTAPDGTSTAEEVTLSASTGSHRLLTSITVPNGTTVMSVFAKAGTHQYIQLACSDSSVFANFDLTAGSGATGTSGGIVSSSITSVGNDWYRCVMVFTASSVTSFLIQVAETASDTRVESWTALGTETVFLWGAQLEQRSAVTDYTPTTTQPITNYIPALQTAASGVARFDHNPITGESLGLLVEEQRSNELTYSEDFADASWTKTRSTIGSNTIIAPDGTLTGDKLIDTTDNDTHIVSKSITTTAVARTFSVFAKQGGRTHLTMTITDSGSTARTTYFNLSTGAVGTTGTGITASIVNVGNGWYRCIVTIATALAGTNPHTLGTATADNTNSYAGNGFDGVFIWGAQAE